MRVIFSTFIFILFFSSIHANTFDISNKDTWLGLLKNKEYTILDSELQKLQDNYLKDVTKEKYIFGAIASFYNSDPELEAQLQNWIKKKPDSIYAHTALGAYYIRIAFLSRGTKFIHKTTKKQISKMDDYARKGMNELVFSIKKKQNLTIAYALMLNGLRISSERDVYKAFVEKALLENPYSKGIRYNHLLSLAPKWGGSFLELKDFMYETSKLYKYNKRLKLQEGYFEYVLADNYRFEKNFDKKKYLRYINKAINASPNNIDFHMARGEAYIYYIKDNEKALKNFNKALEYAPQNSYVLQYVAFAYNRMKKYDLALKAINKAIKYDKLKPRLLRIRGYIYYNTGKKDLAIKDYTDSLIYANSSSLAHWYLGTMYYQKKNYALASEELLKSNAIKKLKHRDWYKVVQAQWYDKDNCAFIKSADKYIKMCDKAKSCYQATIDWTTKTANRYKKKYIECKDLAK